MYPTILCLFVFFAFPEQKKIFSKKKYSLSYIFDPVMIKNEYRLHCIVIILSRLCMKIDTTQNLTNKLELRNCLHKIHWSLLVKLPKLKSCVTYMYWYTHVNVPMRGLLALSYKKEFFVSVAGTFNLNDKTKFSDINYKINVSLIYILIMRASKAAKRINKY